MNSWKLSDGTEAQLGGRVFGSSAFAVQLRKEVLRVRAGYAPLVAARTMPGGWEKLSLGDAWLLDVWLRDHASHAQLSIVSAPELEPPASDPSEDDAPDDEGKLPIY